MRKVKRKAGVRMGAQSHGTNLPQGGPGSGCLPWIPLPETLPFLLCPVNISSFPSPVN